MVLTDDVSRLKMSLSAAEAKAAMLDILPTPVIEIARDYTIAYINPAGAAMLGVNRQHVIGMNSHNVLRTPQCHAGRCMCHQTVLANSIVTGETVLDPAGLNLSVQYTAAPIEDTSGNQVGTLISLGELHQEQRLTEEIQALTTAVEQGDLTARAASKKFTGYAQQIVQSVNTMLETVYVPVKTLTGYVNGMAQGEFSEIVTENYPGHLGNLQQSLIQCRNALGDVIDETNRTTAAIARGKLERRVESAKFRGQWTEFAKGLNAAVESLLTPVRDISRTLEKLASGDLKVRITTTYQGDFHVLKTTCNEIGAQLQDVQETIHTLKTAVLKGQLNIRGELRQAKGQFAGIITAVNEIMDAVNTPLLVMTEYIDRIAHGDVPGKIIDEYKGNFQTIKTSLNGLIEYLQQVEYAIEAVTHGDLSYELIPRSEQDALTLTVQHMTGVIEQFMTEMQAVSEAVTGGRLEARGEVARLQGDFTKAIRGMNRMLDAVVRPLQLTSEYIGRIADGNLPAKLTDAVSGDFEEIQQRTNGCIDTLNAMLDEMTMMVEASARGDWDVRADSTQYEGVWAALVKNINTTAEQVSATIEDVGGMLHRLAAGDFGARLTHEYTGDYNVLKHACNELGEQIQSMRQMLDTLHTDIDNGRLETRLKTDGLKGEFGAMIQHVNRVLDAMNSPIRDLIAYVAHLADGELPEKITVQYQGDFQRMKDGLNALRSRHAEILQVAEQVAVGNLKIQMNVRSNRDVMSRTLNAMQLALQSIVSDMQRQVHAVQEGRLGMRSKTTGANGCWRDLVTGMNTAIDTCVTPFMVMTDYVNRIAVGDVPEKITEEFRGEFNSIRSTLNRLIDTIGDVKLIAREIVNGNLDVTIQERSDKDELMKALREMLAAIRALAESPEILAKGWRIPVPQEDGANGALSQAFQHMVTNFQSMMGEMEKSVSEIQQQNWLRSGQSDLESLLRSAPNATTLAKHLITFLVKHVNAHVGAVYLTHVVDDGIVLRLTGSYAYSVRKGNRAEFALGEGLIGQAALEKEMIVFSEVPDDYVISSGLGRTQLRYILVLPFLHAGDLTGVIELGTVREFTEAQMQFLRQISDAVAVAFHTVKDGAPMQESLEVVQQRTELLQYQEELRLRQQELEHQVAALQESREKLFHQEDDLRGRHGDLDAHAQSLRESEHKLQQRQEELRQRHHELEKQARELRETERKLQRRQRQLQERYTELESRGQMMARSDQHVQEHEEHLQARQQELQEQTRAIRESEQTLQKQREKLRQHYEELEARARMVKESEERVSQQRGNLRSQYEELESHRKMLKEFEERLKTQQEKLEHKDLALTHQVKSLEQQQQELQEKQQSLEKTRQFVQEKMKELERSGKYRPEFLVNLSYKLRTSLNRLLVLSNLLAENKEETLTEKQVEFAGTINTSVTKLLALVNQVLHLTKVESGSVDLTVENISVRGLASYIEQHFLHMAQEKGIFLHVEIEDNLPVMLKTARQHVEQILKHLLANAVKFTEHGSITVHIGRPASHVTFTLEGLGPFNTIAISVTDTGIGIPSSKLDMIFEAFQQADSTIGRKFGGMGLGLAICRGLVRLLRGEIHVQSEPGVGTTFTLYLSEEAPISRSFSGGDVNIDAHLATLPEDVTLSPDKATSPEKVVSTATATPNAPALPDRPRPRLREEALTPATNILPESVSSLLVVDQGTDIVAQIKDVVNGHQIRIESAHTGQEAYERLKTASFDCLILGTHLTDISGSEFLEMIDEDGKQTPLPVLLYMPHRLRPDEEQRLRHQIRGRAVDVVTSPERLRQQIIHWLLSEQPPEQPKEEFHVPEEIINLISEPEMIDLDEGVTQELQQVEELLLEQQQELRMFRSKDAVLNRRTILVVSRERGNVYTLTNVLQEKGAQVLFAENSREVAQQLESRPEVDLVLIEDGLPDKDGSEVIRTIRRQARYVKLPIIALMVTTNPQDYQRCLDAGANDYVFKPVDTDELVSLLRVWLY